MRPREFITLASTASRKQPHTTGRPNMGAWRYRRPRGCGPSKTEKSKLKKLLAELMLDNAAARSPPARHANEER